MTERIWSHYSQALFDAYLTTDDNIIVQACPGAGKTTNAEHIWSLDDKTKAYLVFGKANQEEAVAKLPRRSGSDVLTLNGLGHRAIMNTFGSVDLDTRKVMKIIKRTISPKWKGRGIYQRGGYNTVDNTLLREREWQLYQAVDKAKICDLGTGINDAMYQQMIGTYDLEEYQGMQEDIQKVLDTSDDMTDVIDFNDQIRIPALYECNMPEYDVIVGDEVQDFSPIQALMVSRLNAKRYVLIGDKRQSIYGFRGAMLDSMEYLKGQFNCREMPLSITYRCAKNIVKEAYSIWPEIEAWEDSPQGTVLRGIVSDCEKITSDYFRDPDTLVLCRTNAPLVCMAYGLLKSGIPCHVRGRDIGTGLVSLIHKMECNSVKDLIDNLSAWKETEVYKAQVKEDTQREQSVNDKYETTMLFVNKCKLTDSPSAVIAQIDDMFAQGRGICLSTVHKAKGLEAKQCYMLHSGLHDLYATKARHMWQQEQERNIKYVAVTRAKDTLVYM